MAIRFFGLLSKHHGRGEASERSDIASRHQRRNGKTATSAFVRFWPSATLPRPRGPNAQPRLRSRHAAQMGGSFVAPLPPVMQVIGIDRDVAGPTVALWNFYAGARNGSLAPCFRSGLRRTEGVATSECATSPSLGSPG